MPVPNTFANATATIPLSQLDANFATTITLGNTAIQLGNTVSTLNNMTLANVTVTSGNVTLTNVTVTTANVTNATITTANVTTANIATEVVTTSQTLSYGAANGIVYLNGSKVSTTGASLTFDGTNFATTGSVTSAGASNSGNLTFTGTGNRITGDFSNATVANRVMFQSSTATGNTSVGASPNGTGTNADFRSFNNSDTTNAAFFQLGIANSGTEARLNSSITGTGTYLPMTFYTGGSERMRVDTSGNVGIGTSSPVSQLHLVSASDSGMTIYKSAVGAGNVRVVSQGAGSALAFGSDQSTGTTERMRIDSSGNVGIGTSSPSAFSGYTTVSVNNATNGGIYNILVNGTETARLQAFTNTFNIAAKGASAILTFETNGSERARIDTSGNLLVGTTTAKAPFTVQTAPSSSAYGQIAAFSAAASDVGNAGISVTKYDNVTTTSQVFARFLVNQGATASGQINANGASAAAFGSYSDRRLKENIADLPSQLANIMALRPVEFDYIESEGGGHQIGFIAQEVQEIYPDLVGEREDGMLTLTDLNKNDARLIKALQEQQQMIEELQAKVAALEGKK
jgi:hypothetical protein